MQAKADSTHQGAGNWITETTQQARTEGERFILYNTYVMGDMHCSSWEECWTVQGDIQYIQVSDPVKTWNIDSADKTKG